MGDLPSANRCGVTAGLLALLFQTGAAWYGAGFTWTMQVLNYPLLALVGRDSFTAYERSHNQRFIRVVGPGVLVAVISTGVLLVSPPAGVPTAAALLSSLLLLVIIVATVAFQAPAHGKLAEGFDEQLHARLVRSNWLRTICWTLLGMVDLWMLAQALRA